MHTPTIDTDRPLRTPTIDAELIRRLQVARLEALEAGLAARSARIAHHFAAF